MNYILSDRTLYARSYAEALSGYYPLRCDTRNEILGYLCSRRIYIGKGFSITEIPDVFEKNNRRKSPLDKYYVLVEFPLEENYTEHETRMMPIPKKYLVRVKRYLKEDEELQRECSSNNE